MAKFLCDNNAADASPVTFRVFSSQETTTVLPLMKKQFAEKNLPESFPYRSRSILAFQKHEGRDVCFFAMFCQEYGFDCPAPNSGKVYISYLDSVKHFEPSGLRSKVFVEVISQYLNHVRNIGYNSAHLWSCVPAEGVEYIFHRRPESTGPPMPDSKLAGWYEKILINASKQGIIHDYTRSQGLHKTPYITPYFSGDIWTTVYEDLLENYKVSELEEELKKREEVSFFFFCFDDF